jgi:serine/threonine-protein kinase
VDEPTTSEAVSPQIPSLECGPFRVGDWLVEPSLNRLTRGEQASQLQPKVMDVLVCLARRAGHVVSKNEILEAVWQQEHVADSVLANAVASLRSELGDDARRPRYIATITKRGYRLLAPVEPVDRAAGDPRPSAIAPLPTTGRGGSRRSRAAAAVVAAVAAAAAIWFGPRSWQHGSAPTSDASARPRIVVIPFENLGHPDHDEIAAGFTEEITHRLARVGSLHVISRTTALNYDRSGKTIRQIGRDLDVDYVLEGSVRWQESADGSASFRVTPQLIRVADDSHLWSATFDRSPEQLFAVQSEIGQRIVDELDITLRNSEHAALQASPMADIATYQLYLLGCNHLLSAEEADYRKAIELLERVVERDPGFAPAYARLSEAHGLLVQFGYDTSTARLDAARAAVEKCRDLAPDLPELHRALGLYYYRCEQNSERGLQELALARCELPNDSSVLASIAFIQRRQGHWNDSIATLSQALALDPLNASYLWNQATTLSMLRRWEEADRLIDRAIAVAPGMPTPHVLKVSNTLRWTGDTALAQAALDAAPMAHDSPALQRWAVQLASLDRRWEDALDLLNVGPPGAATDLAACWCYWSMGIPDEAAARCRAVLLALEEPTPDPHGMETVEATKALAFALLGQREQAAQHADRAVELARERNDAVVASGFDVFRASVYSLTGDADAAVAQLEHVLSVPAFLSVAELKVDPTWDPIRDHPGFRRLIAQGSAE